MLRTVLARASWLGAGAAGGQALILLATPFLARHYSPHAFGLLALLMTISNISMAVGCWRYDLALPSSEEADVAGLVRLCVFVAACSALAALVASTSLSAIGLFRGSIAEVLGHPLLLGACVGLAAIYQASGALLLRRDQIGGMAGLRIAQGGTFAALALFTPLGLLWSHALSFFGGMLIVFMAGQAHPSEKRLIEVMRSHRVFVQQGLPGALLDVIGYSLCIWTVLGVYGLADSGKLSQVQRIVGAPLMLASMSLAQILLRHTAELKGEAAQLRRLLTQLLGIMGLTALVALAFLTLFGEQLLGWLLGKQWQVGWIAVLAISGAVMVRACVSPMSSLLATFRRFDLALRWQALYLCSALVLFTTFSRILSFEHFLLFYMAHEMLLYAIYLRIIYSTVRR